MERIKLVMDTPAIIKLVKVATGKISETEKVKDTT